MLTKSDFLLYIDAPMHLWAEHNNKIEKPPSSHELQLFEQGKEIEKLGREYLYNLLKNTAPGSEIIMEKTFNDSGYQARADVVLFDPKEHVYDLYEIKSSTSVRKEHHYDIAFQCLVVKAGAAIRKAFMVHVNREYVREGNLDLDKFFVIEDVTEAVEKLEGEVATGREEARRVLTNNSPSGIRGCVKPESCPCPTLCHPHLPDHPIFDIARLNEQKARDLKARGILSITDIPEDYPLSSRQIRQVQIQKSGKPFIDSAAVIKELSNLKYPLHFLDYETYSSGIPFFNGYRPFQHIVFQYSLHVVASPDSEAGHFEYLITENKDPGVDLLAHLAKHLQREGSVVVWNKTFETGRNSEMAERYPEYRPWLDDVNGRIYDLMDVFEKGYYIHPDFRGSVSIKRVFPVLVQKNASTYVDLPISKGDEAMAAWLRIVTGKLSREEVEQTRQDLLRYCKFDTEAMLKIWKALKLMVENEKKAD
jgi:hypothetical protein